MAKKPLKKSSVYALLAGLLVFVFTLVGLFTLGSTQTTGAAFVAPEEQEVVFNLTYGEKQDHLKAVYVNVGSSFAADDTEAVLTVKTSTSTSSTSGWKDLGTLALSDSGNFFRWVAIAEDLEDSSSTVKRISLIAGANLEINEIACVADNGELIELAVSVNYENMISTLKKTAVAGYDAQESFLVGNSAFGNFTEEEGVYLSAIRTILAGDSVIEGGVYSLPGDFNALALLLMLPSVAIFGESVFALRLTSLLATALMLVGIYLLTSLLFKRQKYAFITTFLFAFGGLATSIGRLGAPYALVTCALVYSVYFAYAFFANGISSARVIRGALNPLFAGLFAAAAIAMETLAVLPALVSVGIFLCGMDRQRRAYAIEKEKLEKEENEEKLQKAKSVYSLKNRAAVGFGVIGLCVGLLAFLLIGGVGAYHAYAKVYGADVSLLAILWKGIAGSSKTSVTTSLSGANEILPLGWFLPLKASTLYGGVADGTYAVWSALANPATTLAAFAAFLFSTVEIILAYVKKETGKKTARANRIYFVLLGGLLATLLAALIKGSFSMQASLPFFVFYLGFIPLALYLLNEREDGEEGEAITKKFVFADWIALGVCVLAVVCFALAVPASYGIALGEGLANGLFGWMSILSNGIFR